MPCHHNGRGRWGRFRRRDGDKRHAGGVPGKGFRRELAHTVSYRSIVELYVVQRT